MASNFKNQQTGFVLLYAVLVSGIVLGVGLSLVNLFTKQIILSSIGRNSQFAYYAADAGKQCAYFWYTSLYPVFGRPAGQEIESPNDLPPELAGGDNAAQIYCFGNNPITVAWPESAGTNFISNFFLDLTDENGQGTCADVAVTRRVVNPGTDTPTVETVIESRGYNSSCAALNTPNPRRIERVVYRVDK